MSHYIKRNSNKLICGVNTTDTLVIDNDGKVGINTTSPGYELDVSGSVKYKNANTNHIYLIEDYNDSVTITDNLWEQNGSDIYYTGGNVGIGTTAPGYELDVSGDINYTGNLYKNGLISDPMVLLETRVVSSSTSTIDFPNVLTTDYHIYKVFITNMTINGDDKNIAVRFSTNNGSSYITSGYYHRIGTQYYTSKYVGNGNYIELSAYTKTDTGGTYNIMNGEFTIYEPTNSNVVTIINSVFHTIDDTNNIYDHYIQGYRKNKENNNAFQIIERNISANFLTATISVYGLKQ